MKLLIVKFSSIGDCVMAVPAASMFRRAFPAGVLVWAVDPRCEAVIQGPPELVTEKFLIPWEHWKSDRVSSLGRVRHYLKLRAYGFDLAVDLQGHAKTAICLRLSGAKRRMSVPAVDGLAKLLNANVNLKSEHTVERNIELLETVGISHHDRSPIMPTSAHPTDLPEPGFISIAVSTGHPKKNLAPAIWDEVATRLIGAGEQVVFVGGPGDVAPTVEGAIDYCGKLQLIETMGVLANSRLHIAGDTGSGHICAAYGIPVVSIFGPTKARNFRPYGPKTAVLQADDLMRGVSAADILAAAGIR